MNEYQFTAEWMLERTKICKANDSEFLESLTFVIPELPDIKYYLTLFPKERIKGKKKEPQAFLWLNIQTKQKISVNCTISVKTAKFKSKMIDQIFDEELQAYEILLSTRSLLLDPKWKFFNAARIMKIELDGIVKLEENAVEEKEPGPMSLSKALWESNNDKDITIIAENKEIKVHKWILCGNSTVFKAEMESGMKESQENKIVITDFKFNTVKTAIEYCYERKIDYKVNEENAYELLHFADKYDINGFKDILQALLIPKITVTNVVKFANMSITSFSVQLLEACINFLLKYAGTKTAINDIKNLDNEIFTEIGRRSFNLF